MALGNSKLLKDAIPSESKKAFSPASFPLWWKVVLFGAVYFLCAEMGSFLSARGGTYVSFWLPAGLSVGVLLLSRTKDWPWFLLAIFPANFLFDFFHGTRLAVIFFFCLGNMIQPLIAAWLLRRFVSKQPTLATLKEFFGLVGFAAIFSTIPSAIIGAATLVYFGLSDSFERMWKVWWGSTAMAVLVLTPFILAWFSKPNGARNVFSSSKKIVEGILLLLAMIIYVSFLLYQGRGIMSMHRSWAVPLLLWAGLRFGLRGATAAVLFLSISMAFFTAQFSMGFTAAQISSGEYVFPMQTILAMASLVALIPAIVIGERNRTLTELRESEERFKNLSAAAFEGICISENGRILDANNQYLAMFGYEERAEVIGRQIIEFVAPEYRDTVSERIRAGHEIIYGHLLLRKDGSIFPGEARAKIIRIGSRILRMTALRDITERINAEREREQAVAMEQKARAEYTLQLIASQEAERARIAGELHDSFGQNLLLIKNRARLALAKKIADDDIREQVEAINDLAEQSIAEARRISHDLHPYQLDHLGLARALKEMVDKTAESSGINFKCKFDNVDDIFSKEAALNLYRVVQESLNNILKHSRAKKAFVRLERDVREVQLQIEDDGAGYNAKKIPNGKTGLGLKNIAERTRILGGKLETVSSAGKGVRITVTIPISESA
jgi:PAS domain S-box-containing protein